MTFKRPEAAGPPENGIGDGNGAIVEMVRQGILKAREKLIDLSLRNGMLNYRHTESSSRHVRVVHQLPSAVVECLASEKSIDLVPLPPVETIPRDEDTDVFRAALRDAKAVDPEWLAAEDAKRGALPAPEPEIACGLLSRMLDPSSAAALSRWADLVMSAREFEASADAICEREKMHSSLGSVRTLLEAAETLKVEGATLDELTGIHAKSRARAEELAGAVGLMRQVLSVTHRDPAAGLDVRAEALAASFLRNVQAFPHAKAHLRSMRLAEDGVLEDIRVAHGFATEASEAASEAGFGEPPTAALAASLPSAREMRAAASGVHPSQQAARVMLW